MSESIDGTVALFSTSFLPYSQTFVYDEIRAHRRYDVDVFCKERLNADRFPYERIYKPAGSLREKLYENMAYWPAFDRILAKGGHALVHAHFGTGAVYALPYVRKHKLPFVVTFHGNDVAALIGPQRREFRRLRYVLRAPRIMQSAELMLCVSLELCETVARLSGRPNAVKPFRLGVDLKRFTPSLIEHAIPRILMVGRFTEKKGHEFALRAFAETLQHGRKAHLTFVGDGELEPACRRFVESSGMNEWVEFAGVKSPSETAEILRSSDLVLVPSVVARNGDREGSPTVVKEAGACAKPVIGTRHAGIPEVIEDGITGFLVPERDVGSLKERMIALIDDPELRRRMGEAARRKMEREFDLFKQVDALESHYDSIL